MRLEDVLHFFFWDWRELEGARPPLRHQLVLRLRALVPGKVEDDGFVV